MAETANLPATASPKAALVAGGNVAAIIPRNIEEVFRLASAMVTSGMAPASLKTPEQAMVAILAGAELGLPPFQSLQSFAIINNRPAIWGDGMIAVVRSNGFRVREWLEGAGDEMVAHCEVTRPDNGEVIARSFSVSDARKANLWGKAGPWQTSPKRMLQMRARGFACRDGAADVLRGFQLREEVEDYQPIRSVEPEARTDVRARLEARGAHAEGFTSATALEAPAEPESAEFSERAEAAAETVDDLLHGDTIPDFDAETGEITEAEVVDDFPGDRPATDGAPTLAGPDFDPASWAIDFNAEVHRLTDVDAIKAAWSDAQAKGYALKLKAHSPAKLKALVDSMNQRVAEIEGAG